MAGTTKHSLADEAYRAVRAGDFYTVEKLLTDSNSQEEENGLDVNQTRWSGWSLLHRAAEVRFLPVSLKAFFFSLLK